MIEAFGHGGGGVADSGQSLADGECALDVGFADEAAAELVSGSDAVAWVGVWASDAV